MRSSQYYILILLFSLIFSSALDAQVLDTAEIETMLQTNRADMLYLNVVSSNLPKDSDLQNQVKQSLEKTVQFDFFARMWAMQGRSGDSFRQIKASRIAMRDGYRLSLGYYIDTAWVLLESSAPIIVRSEDPVAKHYLQLGFRDLEAARILFRQGIRYPKPSPSLGIRSFFEGIRRIRRARRFGLLALIESRTPTTEKERFRTVTLDDLREAKASDDLDTRSNFDIVRDRLINLISRKILNSTIESDSRGYLISLNLLDLHDDNYARLLSDREPQIERIFDELDIKAFHQQESLPKRNSDNRFDVPASDSDPIKSIRDEQQ
ncbi:MAG: hypothetical protein H3C43_03225 [Leptonema sp. (in: Bacteria)]|nr:hypothetical protein [Leptonema sp. (in: bacteria)]